MAESKTDLRAEIARLREQITALKKEKKDHDEDSGLGAQMGPANIGQVKARRMLKGHFGKVYALHWAGDSTHLVTASQDGKLIIWNGMSTNKTNAIPLRSSWVMTCAFEQKNNAFVACGGLDNVCSIYKVNLQGQDTPTTKADTELQEHDGYLSCCRFLPGGNEIITSSGDSTCIQWDLQKKAPLAHYDDHTGDVMTVSISPTDPNLFVSGSCDATLKLWDLRTKASDGSQMTFTGHESDINSVHFLGNGHSIASGSDDSSCRIWDTRACQDIFALTDDKILCGITSVAPSSRGRVLTAGYDDHHAYVWDLNDCSFVGLGGTEAHENRVSCVGFNNSGTAVATGSWDTMIKIWA